MECLRTLESSKSALAVLHRYINRPAAMFHKREAVKLLLLSLRLARNENNQKANEYAATLDEIKTRSDFVDDQQLHRLLLGLLGDHVRVSERCLHLPCLFVMVLQWASQLPTLAVLRFSVSGA